MPLTSVPRARLVSGGVAGLLLFALALPVSAAEKTPQIQAAPEKPAAQSFNGFSLFSFESSTGHRSFWDWFGNGRGKSEKSEKSNKDKSKKDKSKKSKKSEKTDNNGIRESIADLQSQIDELKQLIDDSDSGGSDDETLAALQSQIEDVKAKIAAIEGTDAAAITLLQGQINDLFDRVAAVENAEPPIIDPQQPMGLNAWQVVDSSAVPQVFGSFITYLEDSEVHVLYEFEHAGQQHAFVVKILNGLLFETTIGNAIFYVDDMCTTTPYMKVYDEGYVNMFDTIPAGLLMDRIGGTFAELYVALETDPIPEKVAVMSRRGPTFVPPGECNAVDFMELAVPAEMVMDLYDIFTPPFHVVPATP